MGAGEGKNRDASLAPFAFYTAFHTSGEKSAPLKVAFQASLIKETSQHSKAIHVFQIVPYVTYSVKERSYIQYSLGFGIVDILYKSRDHPYLLVGGVSYFHNSNNTTFIINSGFSYLDEITTFSIGLGFMFNDKRFIDTGQSKKQKKKNEKQKKRKSYYNRGDDD